jgi:uncharacterized protein (TIGR04255 family)
MPPAARHTTLPALPEPDPRLLARPPLEVVIFEMRAISDSPITLGSAEGLRLKDAATAAGFTVERIEPTQQQAISMQVTQGEQAKPLVETRSVGWQLFSADGASIASVLPGVISVQTTRYVSWEGTFRPLLTGALAAFADVLQPQIRQRIGLRYVDRMVDPDASGAAAWRGRVADALLGPIADPALGERVISSQQQVELEIGDNQRALLRHGPFADGALHGAVSYMLDIDVFDTTTTAFEFESTLAVADELNQLALSLFQAALSQPYLSELRGET